MQKFIFLFSFLFSILALTATNAQKSIDFSIKGGVIHAPAYFRGKTIEFTSSRRDPAQGFSSMAQVSMEFEKKFRIGLEGGISKFKNYMVTDILFKESSNNYTVKEAGHYEVSQYHIAGLVEYRFGDDNFLFVNIGGGYFKDQKSEFTSGTRFVFNGSGDLDMTGWSYGRDNSTALFIGCGIRPKIYKQLNLLMEARYTYLPPVMKSQESILLNFNVFNFNFGLAYSFPYGKSKSEKVKT